MSNQTIKKIILCTKIIDILSMWSSLWREYLKSMRKKNVYPSIYSSTTSKSLQGKNFHLYINVCFPRKTLFFFFAFFFLNIFFWFIFFYLEINVNTWGRIIFDSSKPLHTYLCGKVPLHHYSYNIQVLFWYRTIWCAGITCVWVCLG
jgi:hypothetical protein